MTIKIHKSMEFIKQLQYPFQAIVSSLIENNAVRATFYVSPKIIIRATRNLFNKKIPALYENVSITLTIGKPNYLEREFIKLCQKSKEPFPIKKVQLKFIKNKSNKLKNKK